MLAGLNHSTLCSRLQHLDALILIDVRGTSQFQTNLSAKYISAAIVYCKNIDIFNTNCILHTNILYNIVRFEVLMAANIKITILWFVALCSLTDVYRRFRCARCPHFVDIFGSYFYDNFFDIICFIQNLNLLFCLF